MCRFLQFWGRAATLLALLLQLRVLWSKAAIATLQAGQLLSLLLQHKRRERFQQGAAIWLLILLLRHKRRKLLQHGAATRQLFLLLRHKLGWPWPAYTGLLQEYHSFPSRWWWLVFTGQVATGEKMAAWCLLQGSGPPIRVTHKNTTRSLHDGGGLCSPGRWPPGRRRLPGASCDAVQAAFTG